MDYGIIYVTTPNRKESKKIARSLVEKKLISSWKNQFSYPMRLHRRFCRRWGKVYANAPRKKVKKIIQ